MTLTAFNIDASAPSAVFGDQRPRHASILKNNELSIFLTKLSRAQTP
jgi:AcrR family transcriptional regulator